MLSNIGLPGLIALGVLPSFPNVFAAYLVAILPMPQWFLAVASMLVEG